MSSNDASEDKDCEWPTAEDRAASIAQALRLKNQAGAGGLRFEVYLPPSMATWLLGEIERGVFLDPSEAAFVIFKEAEDLQPHVDLRRELLKRIIQSSIDDPRPSLTSEEVADHFKQLAEAPYVAPAIWPAKRSRR